MYLCSNVLQILFLLILVSPLTSLTYEDSYDDDYKGCFQQREMQIKKGYLSCEMKHNWALKHAWDKAWAYWSYQIPPKLDRDTATAVTAYTSNSLFSQLNSAVEGGTHKVTNGYFRSMHLLLTKAIQILRPGNCITTYRGINVFIPLKKGEMFRFGRFASSTTIWHIAQGFGLKMFFIIRTCYGANIAPYSLYKSESEVLIPPYEVFTVTSVHGKQVNLISTGKTLVNKRCRPLSHSCPYKPSWNPYLGYGRK
ncbi:ecto-ADP-ribosyltransferase 5-like [Erpetoichthys calabaricus]|uniref:ecto-ADP-ribosyltransferase 5-like n=1 Tax=Erpetoichthys calabaricus TaxID=27687 RepID=UPI00223464D6|nr:ecto-ADP-ribosyltransferase 5-like [Erpetoichthys calabaricus]